MSAILLATLASLCGLLLQVDWKLTRGKWRPKLLDYAKAHSEATIVEATSAAFKSMSSANDGNEDLKAAMSALTELKVNSLPDMP